MIGDSGAAELLPMPALLRAARAAYGRAIGQALEHTGCDDVPRNGAYVIAAIAAIEVPLGMIIDQLGISKQAAGALVDTLVVRGYLLRSVDPGDRRRLVIALTERGDAAAHVIRAAVDAVDQRCAARVGAVYLLHTRATLRAVAEDRANA